MPGGEGYSSGPGEGTPSWKPPSTASWDEFDEVRPPSFRPFRVVKLVQECRFSTQDKLGTFSLFLFVFLLVLDYFQGGLVALYRDLVLVLVLAIG